MPDISTTAGHATGCDGSIRILHVDDDPDLADIAADFLEHQNSHIEVFTATHPDDGLERLESEEFDCVVTDYQMPDMDGIALIRAVREDYADLPCII